MTIIYKFLTNIFLLISPLYIIFRVFKKKEDSSRFKEKLSIIKKDRGEGLVIWFHAASVGETLSIFPIIESLENEKKIEKILITTITVSSSKILEKKILNKKKIIHQFFPFDVPSLIDKFLSHWSPSLCVFVESEIWPNFILKIKEKKIPLILLNARITNKTFKKWFFLNKFSKKLFSSFDLCLVQNKETENYLSELGAKKIKNYGNLKFTKSENENIKKLDPNLINSLKPRLVWCAASTHNTEEKFCATVHNELKKIYNNVLTIIIPRHVERKEAIIQQLSNLNLNIEVESNCNEIKKDTDIFLVDNYGEVNKYFAISKAAFLGGSLIKHGGQNPIEPSRYNCQIYHGPNVQNFREIYSYLKELKISKEIKNEYDLCNFLVNDFKLNKKLDHNSEKIEEYGKIVLNNVLRSIKNYITI